MDLRFITPSSIEEHPMADLAALRAREDGYLWLDIPEWGAHIHRVAPPARPGILAAVTLPVTAISSVYGMNVIVNAHTHVTQLVIVLIAMFVISGLLLRCTKRQGWW